MSIFKKKLTAAELDARFHEDFDKYIEGAEAAGSFRPVFQNGLTAVYCIVNTLYVAFLKTDLRTQDGHVVGIIVKPEDFKGLTSEDPKFYMFLMNRNEKAGLPAYQVDESFAGQILSIAKKARTKGRRADLTLETKTLSELGLKWYSLDEDI